MTDYLVVGLGLAGISFCEQLEAHGKTYHVISDQSQTSSSVAGGLCNPVILKRLKLPWRVKEQLEIALPYYQLLEKKLQTELIHELTVCRRFYSVEEQNLWFEAADKIGVGTFLSPVVHQNENKFIDAPFGYGKVLNTYRVDTKKLVTAYSDFLQRRNCLTKEQFDHLALHMAADAVSYGHHKARNIVFCEGFGVRKNPIFKYLPINGTKGEYVIIRAPELKEEKAIKASIFCIPLGYDLYKIGANYDHSDKTNFPTAATKASLLEKMKSFIKCDYEVVDHIAGVRPTVVDRKPIIGKSIPHNSAYIFNGLGSRGVLAAPFLAKQLFLHIEKKEPIDNEIDSNRFTKKYFKN